MTGNPLDRHSKSAEFVPPTDEDYDAFGGAPIWWTPAFVAFVLLCALGIALVVL